MKKAISALVLILICLSLAACSKENMESTDSKVQVKYPEKITITQMADANLKKIVLTDKVDIENFYKEMKSAYQLPGIFDMAKPQYRILMGDELYFLWLSTADGTSGTIMNSDDTHTIFSLSESLTKELQDMLLKDSE